MLTSIEMIFLFQRWNLPSLEKRSPWLPKKGWVMCSPNHKHGTKMWPMTTFPLVDAAWSQERSWCPEGEQQEFLWGGEAGASSWEAKRGAGCRGKETSGGIHVSRARIRSPVFSSLAGLWRAVLSLLLQCSLYASGLQRAGDRQEDGGKET